MTAEQEVINLCSSSSEDENSESPSFTRQRIPTGTSAPQTPNDAPGPNRSFPSPPSRTISNLSPSNGVTGSGSGSGSGTTATANGVTITEESSTFSNRQSKIERAAAAPPNAYPQISPNDRQSPLACELLREDIEHEQAVAMEGESFNDENSLEREKLDFLQEHCFACQVPLCHPFLRNVERSCYALHSHPTLKVPVCVVCSDEIANLELTKHELEQEDDDICGLCCSSDNEKMYLCDESACCASRISVCDQCILHAHPTLDLPELEASDQEWSCPCCKPSDVIEKLQDYLGELQERQQSPSGSKETRVESLLTDLQLVESKKTECERALDRQESYKMEMESELTRAGSEHGDIEEVAQEEFDLWLDAQHKHHARLVDMITILQEALEQEGLDLKEYYLRENATRDNSNNGGVEAEDWRIQADRVNAQREAEELLSKRPPPPPREGAEEAAEALALQEIDDLGSISETSDAGMVNPWRKALHRAQDWEIQKVLKAEEEEFAAKHRRPRRVYEKDDVKATIVERKNSSGVRNEASIVVQQCQRRRHKVRTRRRSADSAPRKARTSSGARVSKAQSSRDQLLPLTDSDSSEEEDHLQPTKPGFGHLFENSDVILTTHPHQNSIQVAEGLAKILKPHQKEGVQFMFQNTFHDIAFPKEKNTDESTTQVGGCILAHNMGLGKSLCCVTLLHTLFFHPSLQNDIGQPRMQFAILVAPVNTIQNWENEFGKWTEKLGTHIDVHCLSSGGNHKQVIKAWAKIGGVLLMSDALFRNNVKDFKEELQDLADVIVLDEAHIMLKNKSNAVFKALMGVKMLRRICLTGSPFQNNLFEYFRMASYIRPGVLGNSERSFEKEYVVPVLEGVSTDATDEAKKRADESMNEIQEILEPFVHRKDAAVLLEELPPMQQVVLHTSQTKLQRRLNGAYKRFQKSSGDIHTNNFLHMYNTLRTVHNHPGTLLFREKKTLPKENKAGDSMPALPANLNRSKTASMNSSMGLDNGPTANVNELEAPKIVIKKEPMESSSVPPPVAMTEKKDPDNISIIELLSDSEEEEAEPEKDVTIETIGTPQLWWSSVANKINKDEMKKIENGNKVVLLLHILTHAYRLNEKVVLFSQCLKTLDYIASVLASKDWASQVPSLVDAFPGVSIGGWELGKQFLRIDGTTSASDRGNRVTKFEEDSIRLFLISSRAGGIGINLCSANRVVLFDSHFNPTIDLQALYRCYRYGQQRSVFAYRFLTEGTTEGKVYSRAVNKASLALSLVDGKSFQRLFTAKETEDCAKTDSWACCERCEKWRMFPPQENVDVANLPDKWYCEMMNDVDKSTKIDCTSPERDELWYWNHYGVSNGTNEKKSTSGPIVAMSGSAKALSDDQKEALVARDEILQNLLVVTGGKKSTKVVSRYYFHDALIDQENATKAVCKSEDQSPQPTEQENVAEGIEPSAQAGANEATNATELQTSQPTEQENVAEGVEQSAQAEAKETTTASELQTSQSIEQDNVAERIEPSAQAEASQPIEQVSIAESSNPSALKPPESQPRTTHQGRQRSETNSNPKRSPPGYARPKASKKKRKLDFKTLFSGFD